MITTSITNSEAQKLLQISEGHFFDFKSKRISPAKLSQSISAFANTDGGELYVGIEDPVSSSAEWNGFSKEEDANGIIQVINEIAPLDSVCKVTFLECKNFDGLVLQIEILKSRDIVKSSSSDVFIRRGAQNLKIKTADELERLRLNKGLLSFESSTVSAPEETIANSEQAIEFMLEVIPHQEPANWLRKQQLLIDSKPTVAGVVLFADEPQAIIPKRCGIKVYRYRTSEDEGTRETLEGQPSTIEGSAYNQIYAAVRETKKIIEGIRQMTPEGLISVSYPEETLHEIITNAVLHRDYSIPDDIHIRIYDDRVEVESPGQLPGHITTKNILDERFSRNGNIVRIINKFPNPPNKDVGEGLNTAFRAMALLQLKSPRIVQKDASVLVEIRHEKLASPEERIMTFLDSNESINNRQARDICVIREDWRIRTIFGRMVAAGMIEKTEGSTTSNTSYRKRNPH